MGAELLLKLILEGLALYKSARDRARTVEAESRDAGGVFLTDAELARLFTLDAQALRAKAAATLDKWKTAPPPSGGV